tara:strand:+ start:234 stop:842 length:609 start_codon:yes stop_codon:yes gene_type:complete
MKKSALHMLGVSSPMNQNNGDLPKFSSTKEDAPGYVPPKDSGELKNVSELPGYEPIQGSSGSLGIIGGAGIKLGFGVVKKSLSNLKSFFKQTKAIKTAKPKAIKTATNPRIAAKAKGDMSYLSIAKADRSAYAKMSKGEKAAYDHPAAKTFRETGKTPTDVFRETGKNTVKDLEKIFKKYDTPSGYYTPDVKLMGKGYGMNK